MVEDREYRLIWIIIMTDRVLHYYCVTLSPFDISNVLILSNYFWYFSTPRARVLNPASARSSRAKTSAIQIDCSNVFLLQTLPTWLIYSWEPGDTWDLILAWHSVWIIIIIVLVIMSRLPVSLLPQFLRCWRGMTRSCPTTVIPKPLAMTLAFEGLLICINIFCF